MTPSDILKEGQAAFFAEPPNYQKAKDFFQRVVLSSPKWVEGHLCLASACENLSEFRKAEKAYKQAIQCDPKDPRPRIALGRLLTHTGQPREAIIELRTGIELNPHYALADAHLFLAAAYEKAKLPSKAMEQWKIVASMEPSYPSGDAPMRAAKEKLGQITNS